MYPSGGGHGQGSGGFGGYPGQPPQGKCTYIYTDIRDSTITPVSLLVNWQFIRYDFSNFLEYCVVIFLSIMIWQFSENVCGHFVCQLSFQNFF